MPDILEDIDKFCNGEGSKTSKRLSRILKYGLEHGEFKIDFIKSFLEGKLDASYDSEYYKNAATRKYLRVYDVFKNEKETDSSLVLSLDDFIPSNTPAATTGKVGAGTPAGVGAGIADRAGAGVTDSVASTSIPFRDEIATLIGCRAEDIYNNNDIKALFFAYEYLISCLEENMASFMPWTVVCTIDELLSRVYQNDGKKLEAARGRIEKHLKGLISSEKYTALKGYEITWNLAGREFDDRTMRIVGNGDNGNVRRAISQSVKRVVGVRICRSVAENRYCLWKANVSLS